MCVMTDWYLKLARAIPISITPFTMMANTFLEHWNVSLSIPSYLLAEDRLQCVNSFFTLVCVHFGVKHLTTTAYHPQNSRQAQRFIQAIIARLCHYVAKHQEDWDLYEKFLLYAYNTHAHRSINISPQRFVLRRQPPMASLIYALLCTKETSTSSNLQQIRCEVKACLAEL